MKFEEVLPALREGKEIGRASSKLKITFTKGEYFRLDSVDLLSDDWGIVEKPKKIKLRDLTEKQYETWLAKNCYYTKCVVCPFDKVYCDSTSKNNWINNKDLYSDKFLDQEIEIKEE